jgi:hypothetical protein
VRVNAHAGALRVVTIVVVFLVTLGVSCWQIVTWLGDDAVAVGWTLYPYRRLVAPLTAPTRAPADIVWLGDSTIMTSDPHGAAPYPVLVDRRATRPAGYSSEIVAAPGLDFYAYYALMGPALAAKPRLVVMVANLRLFNPAGFRPFNDLVGFVPIVELPRLLALPYASRGMTAPGVVLAQLAGTERGFTALLLAEGLRRRAADTAWWATLGPELPEGPAWSVAERRERGLAAKLREYARPIGPRHPLVRFAGAAVAMARRSGVRVLVVVSPMPLDVLREHQLFDERRIARGIAALRDAVTTSGGTLVDLHAALPKHEFADVEGHLTADGMERVAALLVAPVALELGDQHLGTRVDTVAR